MKGEGALGTANDEELEPALKLAFRACNGDASPNFLLTADVFSALLLTFAFGRICCVGGAGDDNGFGVDFAVTVGIVDLNLLGEGDL